MQSVSKIIKFKISIALLFLVYYNYTKAEAMQGSSK